jgi:hypothetical protein
MQRIAAAAIVTSAQPLPKRPLPSPTYGGAVVVRRAALAVALVTFASVPARAEPSLDVPLCPPNPSFPPTPFSACEWKLRPDTDEWIPLLARPWAELAPPQALKPWDGAL